MKTNSVLTDRSIGGIMDRAHVQHNPDLRIRDRLAQFLDRHAMSQQEVVSCQNALGAIFHSRRVFAKGITQMAGTPGFVDGEPQFHPIAEMACCQA